MHFSDKRANTKEGHLQFLMLIAFKSQENSLLMKLSYDINKWQPRLPYFIKKKTLTL